MALWVSGPKNCSLVFGSRATHKHVMVMVMVIVADGCVRVCVRKRNWGTQESH